MWLIFWLTITLASVFAITLYELLEICRMDKADLDGRDLMYEILPHGWYRNLVLIQIASIALLIYTAFFIWPILVLFYMHIKNFCLNRTTFERYNKFAYANTANQAFGTNQNERAGSTASARQSVLTMTSSVLAVNLVNDIGRPTDFSSQSCTCCYNVKAMCCQKKVPDQRDYYEQLVDHYNQKHPDI